MTISPPRPIVYMAGPISGDRNATSMSTIMKNVHDASRAWYVLHRSGLVVPVCPHWSAFQDFLTPVPWEEWIERALYFISCNHYDAILRLPGPSTGADKECDFARSLYIPVFWADWIGEDGREFSWNNLRGWVREWIVAKEAGLPAPTASA